MSNEVDSITKPDLKIEDLDFSLLELAYNAFNKSQDDLLKQLEIRDRNQATLNGLIKRLAESKGISVDDYGFNMGLKSFEPKSK